MPMIVVITGAVLLSLTISFIIAVAVGTMMQDAVDDDWEAYKDNQDQSGTERAPDYVPEEWL